LTRKLLLALNFGAILMGLVRPGRAADAAATQPTPASPTTLPADQPAERVGPAGHPNPRPLALHNSFLDRAWQAPVGLLFIGDSITERWRNAPDVWKAHYWQYAPANFGVAGDRTENVLWRIDNGELDHVDPKLVVLMIGTNNINDTPEHIVAADVKIAGLMHQKLPAAKLLVLGLLPRGHDATDPRREKIRAVNAALAKLDDGHRTRYLDVGPLLLDKDGTLQPDMMADFLHPTPKAYQIWADAMQPTVDAMMRGQ
jgi:lysophospholipase L1-like esterase